jgi:hypothetical protein
MILQISFTLVYRIVLETSGANNPRIVELHWRDFAVFVSLSSRTNTRQGLALCDASGALPMRGQGPDPHVVRISVALRISVRGL